MKKGNSVVLENGLAFNLVDSVVYQDNKYFAATSDDDNDETLYIFKVVDKDGEDALELIDESENSKVIDALIQHIKNTF